MDKLFGDGTPIGRKLHELKGAKVLVTGASGVVGFAVASLLFRAGAHLLLHSRSTHSHALRELAAPAVWRHGELDALGDVGRFDLVFHCATYAQPQRFEKEWVQTVLLNVKSLFQMLEVADRLGFASTTELYSGLSVPATEDMVGTTTPQHPRSTYIESKRLGEAICFHSGNAGASRIALAAGPYPRLDDSRALYQIIRRARTERAVRLRGGGANVRQYQYSFACALRFIFTTAWGKQTVYNNAGPYVVSMNELARVVADHMKVEFVPGPPEPGIAGAPSVVSVDMTRTRQEFEILADIDPTFGIFIDAVIEAASDE
jgi:UDP-glucuronate decarboxylase